jgi:hypothetical protein
MYSIVEKKDPFFVKFTYEGINDSVEFCQKILPSVKRKGLFTHYKLNEDLSKEFARLLPFDFEINLFRVSLFITAPGYKHYPHIDGDDNFISLNFGIGIQNDLCTTNWYRKEDIETNYKVLSAQPHNAFRTAGPVSIKPACTTVVKQGVCILHNASIYHDWDNQYSDKERTVMTIRPASRLKMTYDDAKQILFSS